MHYFRRADKRSNSSLCSVKRCFTWNNIVGKCMRRNVNKRGAHKRKPRQTRQILNRYETMFHVKRCRQKNNLVLYDRLRLLEPVRPPQHLILQAAFRKTQDTLCFTWNMPSTTTIWRNNTPDTVSRNRRRHNGEALLLVSRETQNKVLGNAKRLFAAFNGKIIVN